MTHTHTHTHTHTQWVELLCKTDRPVAENSDNIQHSKDISAPGGTLTRNANKRAAAEELLRP
jgi:hypothetical protein